MRKIVAIGGLFLVVGAVIGRLSTPREAGAEECGAGRVKDDAQYCLDADGNGAVEITDAVRILGFLFLGDPTRDDLRCDRPEHDPPHLCQRIGELEAEVGRLRGQLAECRRSILVGNPLPATGQTVCWDASGAGGTDADCDKVSYPGQDGYYQVGCPTEGRFKTHDEDSSIPASTVLDTCTGLMWTQDPVDVNGDGRTDQADVTDWSDALGACDTLQVGGYDDWRLPNVRELLSIVDYGRSDPAIDPVFHAPVVLAETGYYWSSTSHKKEPAKAWNVRISDGHCTGNDTGDTKSSLWFVRAVRSTMQSYRRNRLPATGQELCWDTVGKDETCADATHPRRDGEVREGCPRDGRFVLNDSGTPNDWNDDTVVDNCTGLEWQRTGERTGDWGLALRYCAGLTLKKKHDWRLPNVAELQSLQDYSSRTAIAPEFVQPDGTNIQANRRWYWSSTTVPVPGTGGLYYWAPTVLFGAWFGADQATTRCPGTLDGDGGTRTWNGKDANFYYFRAVRTITPGE